MRKHQSFISTITWIAILLTVFLFHSHLVVAQGYVWANNAGGSNSDAGEAIAKDVSGNIYVTGFFGNGTATFGSITLTGTDIQNLFVAKYDHLTGDCVWAVKADGFLFPDGIALSPGGDIFVTGYLYGTNYFGAITATATGIYDVFAAKMDSSGTWQWATTAGGIGAGMQDYGINIVADAAGNSYLTGIFANTIYFGGTSFTSNGNDDIFIAKLDASGTWQWEKQFGSTYIDDGLGITIDPSGNLYCTGAFSGTVAFGSTTLTSGGGSEDIYVCKLDASGNVLWAKKAGGSTPDYGNAIVRDAAGNLFVTGWYSTTATFGGSSVTTSGGNEVFVARADSNGIWQWAATGGTPGIDIAYDIALDDHDNSYITGYTNAGYPVIFGNDTITLASNYSDLFIAKCDSGGTWQWLSVSGSSSWEVGYGIVAEACNQYVAGYFTLTVAFDSISLTSSGTNSDAVIAQYSDCSQSSIAFSANDESICEKFCINFLDQSVNNPTSWQWLFPGGSPSTSSDQNPVNICYNSPGSFDVTLITTSASGNDTLLMTSYIIVNPTPPAPTITQVGYTLTSSAASGYQWQLNAVSIPGATNQSYTVLQSGLYTVIISDSLGCVNSADQDVVISGIDELSDSVQVLVSPNPSNGNFIVELLNSQMAAGLEIEVMNILGQIVFSSEEKNLSGTFTKAISLNNLSGGIYFIEIKSENGLACPDYFRVKKKIIIAK
ncbi:MAG TPA: SBBP repeat-containing protein [Chitinophagales bacterium]|nr:SBBP repeat-containing protein [Chitinophagales bacterium]